MNAAARVGAIVMLGVGGVWTGVIVTYAVERINLWGRMPVEQYVVDFRRSLYRVDPMQPILAVICTIAAVVFALETHRTARLVALSGSALVVFVGIWSAALMEPLNSKFRRLPEGRPPYGVERIRAVWRWRHQARTVVAMGAMACFAIAVTYA